MGPLADDCENDDNSSGTEVGKLTTASNHFHSVVPLPKSIGRERRDRSGRLIRVASWGIAIRLLVVAAELVGFWFLGHAILFVDAVASTADVIASILIIAAIKAAERPPDDNHPFGHGRIEPLAGLQMALVLIALGIGLVLQQIAGVAGAPKEGWSVSYWVWLIPFGGAILLEMCCQLILRVARRDKCAALVAEAYHYRIDAATSLLAAAGLGLATLIPSVAHQVDHLSAMLIAAILVALGLLAARENLHQVLDHVPDGEWFDRVRESALKVEGVLDVEKIRIQQAGPDAHVDIDIEVEPRTSVYDAHHVAQKVRATIQTNWPAVREVVVHVEPFFAGDH